MHANNYTACRGQTSLACLSRAVSACGTNAAPAHQTQGQTALEKPLMHANNYTACR